MRFHQIYCRYLIRLSQRFNHRWAHTLVDQTQPPSPLLRCCGLINSSVAGRLSQSKAIVNSWNVNFFSHPNCVCKSHSRTCAVGTCVLGLPFFFAATIVAMLCLIGKLLIALEVPLCFIAVLCLEKVEPSLWKKQVKQNKQSTSNTELVVAADAFDWVCATAYE